jgi:hypothetical protein
MELIITFQEQRLALDRALFFVDRFIFTVGS